MKTRRGTDYSLPTDSSIESIKICDDDDTTLSPEIKQQLEGSPSSLVGSPSSKSQSLNDPKDVSTNILTGSGMLDPWTKHHDDHWIEIHTPLDFLGNSSTNILPNQTDHLSVLKSEHPIHDAPTTEPNSTSSILVHSQIEDTILENTQLSSIPNKSSSNKSHQTVSFKDVDELRIIPSTVAHNDIGQKIGFVTPDHVKNRIWKHVTRDEQFQKSLFPYTEIHSIVRKNSRHHHSVGRRSYNDRNLDHYRPSNSRQQNFNHSNTNNSYHEKNKKQCSWEKKYLNNSPNTPTNNGWSSSDKKVNNRKESDDPSCWGKCYGKTNKNHTNSWGKSVDSKSKTTNAKSTDSDDQSGWGKFRSKSNNSDASAWGNSSHSNVSSPTNISQKRTNSWGNSGNSKSKTMNAKSTDSDDPSGWGKCRAKSNNSDVSSWGNSDHSNVYNMIQIYYC